MRGKGFAGAFFGGLVGFPIAFIVYFLIDLLVMPYEYSFAYGPMVVIVGILTVPFVIVGWRHATHRSRATQLAIRGLGGFIGGFLLGAASTLVLAIAAAEIFQISQMEGAYAMGVVFVIVPFGALVGGTLGAVFGIYRGIRKYPSQPRIVGSER